MEGLHTHTHTHTHTNIYIKRNRSANEFKFGILGFYFIYLYFNCVWDFMFLFRRLKMANVVSALDFYSDYFFMFKNMSRWFIDQTVTPFSLYIKYFPCFCILLNDLRWLILSNPSPDDGSLEPKRNFIDFLLD